MLCLIKAAITHADPIKAKLNWLPRAMHVLRKK
jgi:hypothetical protein